MHLTTRNVNTAFRELVEAIAHGDGFIPTTNDRCPVIKKQSRNGPVLMIDEPVTVTYTHPRERVLFNAARDANPFFHLYEALWMLAGRNDVASVAYYAKQMNEYSDDGKTMNGAYGWRWRRAWCWDGSHGWGSPGRSHNRAPVDQLDLLVAHLNADPNSRRAVLQMWNVEDDLLKTGGRVRNWQDSDPQARIDLPASKDVCCNLSVMFSLRDDPNMDNWEPCIGGGIGHVSIPKLLDMTVTNRSNDLVWGMLGANYVHFTFLQEYMAARLGAEVGKYHQFTNNLHVYDWNWKPDEWLADEMRDEYSQGEFRYNLVPLVKDPEAFERELPLFVECHSGLDTFHPEKPFSWQEPFLQTVAHRALCAFQAHKMGKADMAASLARSIQADDWRVACEAWLRRRRK